MKRILSALFCCLFCCLIDPSGPFAAPQRYVDGVTNVPADYTLGQYIALDPTAEHEWFDDFYVYVAGNWVVTTDESGTGSATEAVGDEDGGVLVLTNAAGDDDHDFLQTVDEVIALESGKKTWFKARFKVSGATQSDFVVGLQVRDTSPLAVSDGLWFQKDDGDTLLDFHVAKASSQSSQTSIITDVADDTYLTMGFYYNGLTSIQYFVNNTLQGTVTTSGFPTTELTLSFGLQNGVGDSAKSMNIDYLMAAKER